ncbi:hypothetical protein SUGI_0135460 [Cryptomeria japonica]|nr:hypothetical protein SUGI_0135460 [Cryptomeria japonica]
MSDAACALSFGKFLELSFSNHAAASGAANCGRSLHRDCLRFYGLKIRLNCFLLKRKIAEFEGILQKEKTYLEDMIQKSIAKDHKPGQSIADILELNRVRFRRNCQSHEWKNGLQFLAYFLKRPPGSSTSTIPEELNLFVQKEKNKDDKVDNLSVCEKTLQRNRIEKYDRDACKIVAPEAEGNGCISGENAEDNCGISEKLKSRDTFIIKTQVKQALTYHPLSTDCNGNGMSRLFQENKLTDTVDGGDRKDCFVGDFEFNKTQSEGNVRKSVNLSDTLDTAWTGEGQSIEAQVVKITYQGQEVGPGPAIENASADTESSFRNEHDPLQGEKNLSPTAVKADMKSDILEDFGSWIGASFSDLYKVYSKSFQGSLSGFPPRFDSLDNHIPSFVSSVSQLGDQGGARLSLVPGVDDIIIVIYDDEPTSIIAYSLTSHDYHAHISDTNKQKEKEMEKEKEIGDSFGIDAAHFYYLQASEGSELSEVIHREKSYGSDDSFTSGSKVACSLKHSGKNVAQQSWTSFIPSAAAENGEQKFAPEYFKYLSDSLSTGSPTCLAKILGIYQVTTKHAKGGREVKMDLMLMENLLYGRNVTRLYDLKGSVRSRYNPDSTGSNKVLLDQNLLEAMLTSPIFVGNKAKRLLERAVWNDTAFLALIDVMDYSLLVGVDEERRELVLGIIDFLRQYTWDKHIETQVKASGILGGPKNTPPTVIPPKPYKKCFRKEMSVLSNGS